jgi:hypothetical protein
MQSREPVDEPEHLLLRLRLQVGQPADIHRGGTA